MRLSSILGGLAACLSLLAPAAAALEMDEALANVQGWRVGRNTSLQGCIAKATYEGGTTVWFGFDGTGKEPAAYIAFTNPAWRSIESKKTYDIQIRTTTHGNWRGTFFGIDRGGEKGLALVGLKLRFLRDFAAAHGMSVVLNGRTTLARPNLSGSRAALDAVIECQSQTVVAKKDTAPVSRSQSSAELSGTGFFVSSSSHVLTNQHVVDGCVTATVTRAGMPPRQARVVASDAKNDLALLSTDITGIQVPPFRTGVRLGESVFVFGFPLSGLLSSSGNFTVGTVTASAGLGDDTRMVQISAPVQPGNSGGPLLDKHGNVVGVIVGKLNALRLAQATQDLPQNVNFAIKTSIALNFLEANNVAPPVVSSSIPLEPPEIADRAKALAVFITCKPGQ